jgi:diaminopropionate ammonia-lyase
MLATRMKLPQPAVVPLFINADWRGDLPYDGSVLSRADMADAAEVVKLFPGYAPTPLRSLAGLAGTLGLGEVSVKDEAARFGMGGIKALGAPYGLRCLLARQPLPASSYTAVAATDGNHGLALAWAARQFGCHACIYVGKAVGQERRELIRSLGAELVVIDGTYDAAVAAAEEAARDPRVLLVTDTDYAGDLPVTRAIMAGYSVLAQELARQADLTRYTHVFLQCGVGGVAAGIAAGLWLQLGRPPRVVTVEPANAACLFASLRAGHPVQVAGMLETRMIGLACGQPSLPAWNILSRVACAAMTLDDADARLTQDALATGVAGDPALLSGATGIAGIAGLCAAAGNAGARAALGLSAASRVLLVSSEGMRP